MFGQADPGHLATLLLQRLLGGPLERVKNRANAAFSLAGSRAVFRRTQSYERRRSDVISHPDERYDWISRVGTVDAKTRGMDTLTGPPRTDPEEDAEPSDNTESEQAPEQLDAESVADTLPDGKPPPQKAPSKHPPPPPTLRARATAHEGRPLSVEGEPRLARDLMTRHLLTIGPDDPIMMLEEHMEAFRFRHLPVVDGDVLVGIISHSDLLHASSSRLSRSAGEENAILHRLPARCIMREEVVTVRPSEPLERVAALLWETRVGCVPVTEEDGRLVGIITEGDFVRLTHHFLTTAEPRYPGSESSEDRVVDDIVRH